MAALNIFLAKKVGLSSSDPPRYISSIHFLHHQIIITFPRSFLIPSPRQAAEPTDGSALSAAPPSGEELRRQAEREEQIRQRKLRDQQAREKEQRNLPETWGALGSLLEALGSLGEPWGTWYWDNLRDKPRETYQGYQ